MAQIQCPWPCVSRCAAAKSHEQSDPLVSPVSLCNRCSNSGRLMRLPVAACMVDGQPDACCIELCMHGFGMDNIGRSKETDRMSRTPHANLATVGFCSQPSHMCELPPSHGCRAGRRSEGMMALRRQRPVGGAGQRKKMEAAWVDAGVFAMAKSNKTVSGCTRPHSNQPRVPRTISLASLSRHCVTWEETQRVLIALREGLVRFSA
ncbi:hypothetical protein B0I37DRAFT_29037 [Chaetomium sp. MPI-CAGE-AT-0009]|nr:hypothetical protein B0I37DRAFT_29037 [Chaetomium sp. MPI-CAGE-AT-0009]